MGTKSVETESGLLKKSMMGTQGSQRLYDPSKTGAFHVHGKLVLYSKKSLFLFDEKNMLRKIAVWFVEWK